MTCMIQDPPDAAFHALPAIAATSREQVLESALRTVLNEGCAPSHDARQVAGERREDTGKWTGGRAFLRVSALKPWVQLAFEY
jgi:hypothetical protein